MGSFTNNPPPLNAPIDVKGNALNWAWQQYFARQFSQGQAQGHVLADGTANQVLHGGSTWSAVDLAADVSGVLPQVNGGLGAASISAALDAVFGSAQGDILYRDATLWQVLPPGTVGYVLATQGAGANPIWTNAMAIKNIYRGVITIPSGSGSATATIPAVVMAKSELRFLGFSLSVAATVSSAPFIVLTNTTTITATAGISSAITVMVAWELTEHA